MKHEESENCFNKTRFKANISRGIIQNLAKQRTKFLTKKKKAPKTINTSRETPKKKKCSKKEKREQQKQSQKNQHQ